MREWSYEGKHYEYRTGTERVDQSQSRLLFSYSAVRTVSVTVNTLETFLYVSKETRGGGGGGDWGEEHSFLRLYLW